MAKYEVKFYCLNGRVATRVVESDTIIDAIEDAKQKVSNRPKDIYKIEAQQQRGV